MSDVPGCPGCARSDNATRLLQAALLEQGEGFGERERTLLCEIKVARRELWYYRKELYETRGICGRLEATLERHMSIVENAWLLTRRHTRTLGVQVGSSLGDDVELAGADWAPGGYSRGAMRGIYAAAAGLVILIVVLACSL